MLGRALDSGKEWTIKRPNLPSPLGLSSNELSRPGAAAWGLSPFPALQAQIAIWLLIGLRCSRGSRNHAKPLSSGERLLTRQAVPPKQPLWSRHNTFQFCFLPPNSLRRCGCLNVQTHLNPLVILQLLPQLQVELWATKEAIDEKAWAVLPHDQSSLIWD